MTTHRLPTEQNNPCTATIAEADTLSALRMIHREDTMAVAAMEAALPTLAAAADAIAARLKTGGRLFYVGAGTSGRIGVLDASELPATYGVDPLLVTAVVPGGYATLPDARLGDEDDRGGARADLAAQGLSSKDAVVGIAASGRTPYTHEALVFARESGAFTLAITNVPHSLLSTAAEMTAVIDTGAEVIQGSTRMKAGTTQKMALNMLSTVVMIRLGKVYQNRMIDMDAVNEKLHLRSVQMLKELTNCDEQTAVQALADCDGKVKFALVMICRHTDADTARAYLAAHDDTAGAWLWEETQ